ncbi:hypothetical protein GX50_02820 [[Emmonsia] crescens]|uniref:Uncharacterized protein n=1 Tax=[Emmonsia] crescens TaxID=73230 RepID=A0A2B7ZNG8_9EURO|nr:hypothetical protein GX50_02820 [Emmonsia crescens]
MGLLDSSYPSKAQLFSPTKVQQAHEINAANEQIHKEDAKLQHAILKEQKEAAATEQRMARETARQITAQLQNEDRATRATKQKLDIEARAAKNVIEQQMRQKKQLHMYRHE